MNSLNAADLSFKIKMMMVPAPRIETRAALRAARFTLHILRDTQLRAALAAQNCFLRPLLPRPRLDRMPSQSVMAILARVKFAAALHLDRYDVRRPVIMRATGLAVEVNSAHS